MDRFKITCTSPGRWHRRLALLLAITLTGGSLGVITPRAETLKQDEALEILEEDLESPETWDMSPATGSEAERATLSDALLNKPVTDGQELVCEFIDLGDTLTTAGPSASFFGLRDGTVDLSSGSHERWIDRVILPDYAMDFYDMLVEGSDNDGVSDILIDAGYFSKSDAVFVGSDGFNGIPICQYTNSNDLDYIQHAIRAAYDAFDRDHPEVFWLRGSTQLSLVSSGYGTIVYFVLRSYSGDSVTFDIRASQYQSQALITRDIEKRDRQVDEILRAVTDQNEGNQIKQLNQWLTIHNEYNTTTGGDYPWNSRECLCALMGNTGTNGPVCEGYARALKVLCDTLGIPCVLVDGNAGGPHMWNYVQIEGQWYAVDVTWNDPLSSSVHGAVSGRESEDWLLLGSDTIVTVNSKRQTFLESHPVANTASKNGVGFTNGPTLSQERYLLKPSPKVTFSPSSQTVAYTGQAVSVAAPRITVETDNGGTRILSVTPSYSYQRLGAVGFTSGLPVNAGTYIIRAQIPATDEYFSAFGTMTLTIRKSVPSLSVASSYSRSKTYDGRPYANPGASQIRVSGTSYENVKFTWYRNAVSETNRLNSAPADAGTYVLVTSVDETDNTQAVSVSTNISIGRRGITVAANPASKTYGESDPELTYGLTEGALADGDSLIGSLARQPGEDAGTYLISQGSLTGANNPNYEISFRPETFTIRKAQNIPAPQAAVVTDSQVELKPVELGSGGGTVQYGFSQHDDPARATWQTSPRFSGLASGTTYYFFVRISGSANYEDSWGKAPITTEKTVLDVPKFRQTYVYTGNEISVNLSGYDPQLMSMTGAASGIDAGDYTLQFRLLDTARYAWKDQSEGTASVTSVWTIEKANQAALVFEAVEAKTYGDSSFQLNVSGGSGDGQVRFTVPEGSRVLSVSGNEAAIIGAGTVRVTAVKAGNANYNDSTPVTIDITVAKKPVTVRAADKTRTVRQANPELTLITPASGVLAGDDNIDALGVTLSTTARTDSPAGTDQITGVAAPDTNYQVTVQPGTLTVTRSGSSSGSGGGSSSGSGGGSGSGSGGGSGSGSGGGSGSGSGSGSGGSSGPGSGGGSGSGSGSSSGSGSGKGNSSSTLPLPSPGSSSGGSWSMDGARWRFLNSTGSYAAGRFGTDSHGNTREFIAWQLINNVWWAFGADSYAKEGWILDASSDLWYSIDINVGMRTSWYLDGEDNNWYFLEPSNGHMLTGWQLVNGVWYYLNPVSQAGRPLGAMYHNERTPDGYWVREDGSWTGQ